MIECRDEGGTFTITRLHDGWSLGTRRRFSWETVCATYLPGTIIRLPDRREP